MKRHQMILLIVLSTFINQWSNADNPPFSYVWGSCVSQGVLNTSIDISFSGNGTYDSYGLSGHWEWDFDYQGTFVADRSTSAINATWKYTNPGTYTVAVRYYNCNGTPAVNNSRIFQVTLTNLKRFYYVKDHLGSVRVTVNEAGTVVASNDLDPWGYQIRGTNSGSANEKYKFTGKERDVETGYDCFGARYYDGSIGRWMSVDPLAEKYPSLSSYNYVANNPMIFVDPNGMDLSDFYSVEGKHLKHVDDNKDDVYVQNAKGTRKEAVDGKEATFEKLGTVSDFLDLNGATISDSKLSQTLVGFAIYLRNEGYSDATIALTGPRAGDRSDADNTAVDGSPWSRHLTNQGADYHVPGRSDKTIAQLASMSGLWPEVVWHSESSGRPHVHSALGGYNRKVEYQRGKFESWFLPQRHLVASPSEGLWRWWVSSFPKFK